MPTANEVRLAIAAQPTVAQGVTALLRAVAWAGNEARKVGLTKSLDDLVGSIEADAKSWFDAVFANTPAAIITASPAVPEPEGLPAHLAPAMASPIATAGAATAGAAAADAAAADAAASDVGPADAANGANQPSGKKGSSGSTDGGTGSKT